MYKLICMSFDGEYVIDFKGTLEECQDASANMGSKWYFYPWHVVLTQKDMIKEAYGCWAQMSTGKPLLSLLFDKRKFSTMQKAFKAASVDPDTLELEADDYESFIVESNQDLLR